MVRADYRTTLMDVQARWGYSEIIDSNSSTYYDHQPFKDQLDALRDKRRSGVPFKDLTAEDRYWLALICWSIRPNLMILMTGIDRFREQQLSKTALAALIVPPMVSNILKFMPFAEYIETPCSAPGDARNVTGGYRASADPLTLGRFQNSLVLLDGYHRAASFWKFALPDASVSVYVPWL
jgi:hypothetical protein